MAVEYHCTFYISVDRNDVEVEVIVACVILFYPIYNAQCLLHTVLSMLISSMRNNRDYINKCGSSIVEALVEGARSDLSSEIRIPD